MAAKGDEERENDQSVEESAERLTRQVRDKVKESAEEPEEEKEEEPEEDSDEPEEEDETDSEPTRREKRANRWREMQERADRAERAAQAALAAQQQLMQQWMASQQPREPQEDPSKRYEEDFVRVQSDQIQLSREYNQRAQQLAAQGLEMGQEEQHAFARRNFEIEKRKTKLMGDLYTAQNVQQVDPAAQQRQTELAVLRAQHADVFANRAASLHVGYAYQRMIQAEGKPDSLQTAYAAVEEARRVVLKQGSAPKPTKAQQAKFTGSSTGAGGPAREGVPIIRVGPEGRRMADAAFPHIKDDKKRYEMWGKSQYQAQQREKAGKRPA